MKTRLAPLRDPKMMAVVAVLTITVMTNLAVLAESLAKSCVPVALAYIAYTLYGMRLSQGALIAAGGSFVSVMVLF